jgi:hypothetical protein
MSSSDSESGKDLARNLAQVISEPVLYVPGFVEAAFQQRFDAILCSGPPERRDARIPTGAEFNVRREAGVDEALGVGDRPFVEPGDPVSERLHERVQIGVGQGAINLAVGFGLICPEVFRA